MVKIFCDKCGKEFRQCDLGYQLVSRPTVIKFHDEPLVIDNHKIEFLNPSCESPIDIGLARRSESMFLCGECLDALKKFLNTKKSKI